MRVWAPILTVGLLCGAAMSLRAADVGLIKIDGAIGPATATYISRAITVATERQDACLIIELDTPGGLPGFHQRKLSQTYMSPRFQPWFMSRQRPARAASAGAFITMAADIAAMAPHTRIGAAHPVSLGASGEAEKTDDTMKKKMENDTASFAESIADKRNRNVDWARSTVLESVSITAEKALDLKVIDLISDNVPDLLQQIDGREINGQKLHTAKATVVDIPMSARESFLQLFLRSEVMFILMLVVIYGIIGELSSPGAISAGSRRGDCAHSRALHVSHPAQQSVGPGSSSASRSSFSSRMFLLPPMESSLSAASLPFSSAH